LFILFLKQPLHIFIIVWDAEYFLCDFKLEFPVIS
jgi:hypothetical protein